MAHRTYLLAVLSTGSQPRRSVPAVAKAAALWVGDEAVHAVPPALPTPAGGTENNEISTTYRSESKLHNEVDKLCVSGGEANPQKQGPKAKGAEAKVAMGDHSSLTRRGSPSGEPTHDVVDFVSWCSEIWVGSRSNEPIPAHTLPVPVSPPSWRQGETAALPCLIACELLTKSHGNLQKNMA